MYTEHDSAHGDQSVSAPVALVMLCPNHVSAVQWFTALNIPSMGGGRPGASSPWDNRMGRAKGMSLCPANLQHGVFPDVSEVPSHQHCNVRLKGRCRAEVCLPRGRQGHSDTCRPVAQLTLLCDSSTLCLSLPGILLRQAKGWENSPIKFVLLIAKQPDESTAELQEQQTALCLVHTLEAWIPAVLWERWSGSQTTSSLIPFTPWNVSVQTSSRKGPMPWSRRGCKFLV